MEGKASVQFMARGCMSLLECPIYYITFLPRVGEVVYTPELIQLGDDLNFEDNGDEWIVDRVCWDFSDEPESDVTIWVTHPQYQKAIERFNRGFEKHLQQQYGKGGSVG